MRKLIGTTIAAIAATATVAIGAQTPAPQTTTPSTSANEQKVVVTGCLKEAPSSTAPSASTAGTAGTTAGTAAAGTTSEAAANAATPSYILTNASMAPATSNDQTTAGATTATGTTGTTGTTAAGTAGTAGTTGAAPGSTTSDAAASGTQTYRLIANATALTPHVGKKLELTGVLDNASSASMAGTAAAGPALRVQSGKIVANSCE